MIIVFKFASSVHLMFSSNHSGIKKKGENIATRSTVDGEGKNETAINSTLESSTTTVGPIECDEIYDSVLCWPRVIAGTVAKVSCRQAFRAMGLPDPENSLDAVVTIDSQVIHFRGRKAFSSSTKICLDCEYVCE